LAGVGIDIVDLDRAERFVGKHGKKLKSFFLPEEYQQFLKSRSKARYFALLFSAKEAVSKSLGITVTHPYAFRDYEIIKRASVLAVRLRGRVGRGKSSLRVELKAFRIKGGVGVLAFAYKRLTGL